MLMQALAQGSCRGVGAFAETRHRMQACVLLRILIVHVQLRAHQMVACLQALLFFKSTITLFFSMAHRFTTSPEKQISCPVHI
jgi:hypothetical protein